MLRTLALAVSLVAVPSLADQAPAPAAAPAPAPSSDTAPGAAPSASKLPHLRLYLGGAAANEQQNGAGQAFVAGIQGLTDVMPVMQWYWDVELWGVVVGTAQFPMFSGDLGARLTPFPTWFVRPYVRAGLGLTLLIILPVPSVSFGLGLNIPLFGTFSLEGSLAVRRAFNVFDATRTLDLGVVEFGLGF